MIKQFTAVLDSTPVKIFFAVWTGIYLVQILRKSPGIGVSNEVMWVAIAFVGALILLPQTSGASTT